MSAALLLAGCAGPAAPAEKSTTPMPSSSAVFASKEEAAQELSDFYAEYTGVVDDVLNDGGQRPERLSPYLSTALYASEVKTMAALSDAHRHTSGRSSATSLELQDADLDMGTATAYVCVDLTKVRVLDSQGNDVTPRNRPNRQTLAVSFQPRGSSFVIDRSVVWAGTSVC